MTIRKPDYFDSFRCIGGTCKDTCCAGWEIEVDEESCSRYLQMKGKTGKWLRRELTVTPEESYFALKDGKCPFLNQDGWCELILAEGEDILCDICREHPRFYNWYGSHTEIGLGLCCEEAERLLFSDSKPAAFVTEIQEDGEDENEEEEAFVEQMMKVRETAFHIVQNREFSLSVRLRYLEQFGELLQGLLDNEEMDKVDALCEIYRSSVIQSEEINDIAEVKDNICNLLSEYASLEALDETWPTLLLQTANEADTLLSQSTAFVCEYPQTEWEYEHLIVYFLNRYFMEAVFDMDVLSKIRFGLAALLVIRLLDIQNWIKAGKRTKQDRDNIVRKYSKEIEYCPENVADLTEACWTLVSLQSEALNKMILSIF